MSTLYRKYRPQRWSDVAGQNHVKVALSFEIQAGRVAHAYLFSGPRGIGKTTVARLLAKAVNCLERPEGSPEPCDHCEACRSIIDGQALDVIEIDAASHRGIDNVRDNIVENARFSPARLKYKVFIIDEVHMLTTEAFNALLKTIEEPPPQVIFILATTELHKVPATIVSRCQRFDFRRIPFVELVERLHMLVEREGFQVDRAVLEEVARNSDGCLRDAESLLGKVLTVADDKRHVGWDEAAVVLPRSDYAAVIATVEALLRRDAAAALERVQIAVAEGCDLDQFAADAIETLRRLLVLRVGGSIESVLVDLDTARREDLERLLTLAVVGDLVRAIETLIDKRREIKTLQPPQLALELAIARICADLTTSAPVQSAAPRPAPVAPKPIAPAPVKAAPSAVAPAVAVDEAAVAPAAASDVSTAAHQSEGPTLLQSDELESVSPSEAAAVCAMSLEATQSLWPQFLTEVGQQHPSLQFLLGACEPVDVKDDVLQVGTAFAFHQEKLNSQKVRQVLEDILNKITGRKFRLEGVALEKKNEIWQSDSVTSLTSPLQPVAVAVEAAPDDAAHQLAEAFGGNVVE